jgi:uncharacterized protein YhaN
MDKKELTDEEIIKAYEYCVLDDGNCDDCPYEACGCGVDGHDIIDIINRQKAEIERLTIAEKQYLSEIKRLNKSCGLFDIKLKEQIKETYDYVHKADKLKKRNAELQKQVEELTEERYYTEQDTAKEILQELYDQIDENTPKWVGVQIKIIAKRKGVEVG